MSLSPLIMLGKEYCRSVLKNQLLRLAQISYNLTKTNRNIKQMTSESVRVVLDQKVLTRCTFTQLHPIPIPPHTVTICLLMLTSLPVWKSAAGKVTDLTNCISVPLQCKLISSSLTFYLSCSFFFYQLSIVQNISYVCLVCLSPSYLFLNPSLLVFPLHNCHTAPLSQGDPASQSPLSVRLGPLLILLHLSCLSPPLWEEFMTVP